MEGSEGVKRRVRRRLRIERRSNEERGVNNALSRLSRIITHTH